MIREWPESERSKKDSYDDRERALEMKEVPQLSFVEFAKLYWRRDTPPTNTDLHIVFQALDAQRQKYNPEGWFLLQCKVLDSYHLGETTILPYGPNNPYREVPTHPVSPQGLASDMSVVIAVLKAEDLPLDGRWFE